ncbi:MAG: twin-arginine translocation signal domain-containing protein [Albidovulum sp.]|nr:twin-arginine translocation signal domain-containing protein [Albidovulum sp.]
MKENVGDGANRRDFLKLVSVSAPAAAAATVAGQAQASAAIEAGDTMQDTLHVRTYYESARF